MSTLTFKQAFTILMKDPRVASVWQEEEGDIWLDLKDGFNHEGCSSIHRESAETVNLPRYCPFTAIIQDLILVRRTNP